MPHKYHVISTARRGRRCFLGASLILLSPLGLLTGCDSPMDSKKPIKQFGKTYDYLKDAELRTKETDDAPMTVTGADLSGEDFKKLHWHNIRFVDCDFKGAYAIRLIAMDWVEFENCRFSGIFGLGHARDVKFLRCQVFGESILSMYSDSKNLVFEECEFTGTTSDPNHEGGIICDGEIEFINCKAKWFSWEGYKKNTLRRCTTYGATLGTQAPGEIPQGKEQLYSDVLLEDCDLTRGLEVDSNRFQNFIVQRCRLGVLLTERSDIMGDVLIKDIKEGFVSLASTTIEGRLVVDNCRFFNPYKGFSCKFNCDEPVKTLIQNVVCGDAPADLIIAGNSMTPEQFLPQAKNQSLIIRNCKIPTMNLDWAQTEHLRIENCEVENLNIRDGRIGLLEIVGTRSFRLDLSRTQVKKQNITIPQGSALGHVTLLDGSNIKLEKN